jgi:hypothetical protein
MDPLPSRAYGSGWLAGAAFAGLALGGGVGTVAGKGVLEAQLARVGDKLDRVGDDVVALRSDVRTEVQTIRVEQRDLEGRLRALEQAVARGGGS